MIPIKGMKLIQIEATNACVRNCANCTRLVGHHRHPFYMTLPTVVKAIDSLKGYPGNIGLMGGEPTLHPQFKEICEIFQMKIPDKRRRELWTGGYKWDEYESVILETFDKDLIAFNDHSTPDGKHHPMLVAAGELIEDDDAMWRLISDCWVQRRWSASITPKGAFFCEVAAALSHAFDGPRGWPIEPGWWKNDPMEQASKFCGRCGAVIPIGETSDRATYDIVSLQNIQRLYALGSPKILAGNFAIYNRRWTEEEIKAAQDNWKPYNFRTFYGHTPEDYLGKSPTGSRQVKKQRSKRD